MGDADGGAAFLVPEGGQVPNSRLPQWLAAAGTKRAFASGHGGAVAIACAGFASYVILGIAIHDSMAAASWAFLTALVASSLGRLLWSLDAYHDDGKPLTSPVRLWPDPEKYGWWKSAVDVKTIPQPQQTLFVCLVGAAACQCVTIPGWLLASEWGAAFWTALCIPLTLGCAAASVSRKPAAAAASDMEQQADQRPYATCCWPQCKSCCASCGAVAYFVLMILGAYHACFMGAFFQSPPAGELVPISVPAGGKDGKAGELVQAADQKMHIHCMGQGEPTVVFMHGYSGQARDWSWVQPEVAKVTRTCSFDRSGCGISQPGPAPRTSEQIAAEAYSLLEAHGITGGEKVIVVSHSFGGYNSRMLRSRHPELVGGLVMVDPADPFMSQDPKLVDDAGESVCQGCHSSQVGGLFWLQQLVAPFGFAHPMFASGLPALLSAGFRVLPEMPPGVYEEYLRPLMGWRYYHTNTKESEYWGTSQFQVGHTADVREGVTTAATPANMGGRGGDGSMGDIPLVLITANTGLTRSWVSGPTQQICFDHSESELPSTCPLPRWPTNANLSSSSAHTEWIELVSDHYVQFRKGAADVIAGKTVDMVHLLRGGQ